MTKTDNLAEHLGAILARDGERWRDEYRASMAQFAAGVRLQAARPVAIGATPQKLLWGGSCRLVGWSLRAASGTATLTLRNGRDDAADIVATVTLSADGVTDTRWLAPGGVSVTEALWATYTGAGTVTGAVYLGAVD
jgi:hypothetical protein